MSARLVMRLGGRLRVKRRPLNQLELTALVAAERAGKDATPEEFRRELRLAAFGVRHGK